MRRIVAEQKIAGPKRKKRQPPPPARPVDPSTEPEIRAVEPPESPEPAQPAPWPDETNLAEAVDDDPGALVRPYARTGGRTRPMCALELETLLSMPHHARFDDTNLQSDHRSICSLCRDPHSTAEVAAHLGLPLGVTKILISDLVDQGLLRVHDNAVGGDARPSMDLLQRVHDGLLNLV